MPACQNSQVSLVSNPQTRLQPQVALHLNKTLFFTTKPRPKTPSCSCFTSIAFTFLRVKRKYAACPKSSVNNLPKSFWFYKTCGRFPLDLFVCLHKTRSGKDCCRHHLTMGVYSKNVLSTPSLHFITPAEFACCTWLDGGLPEGLRSFHWRFVSWYTY